MEINVGKQDSYVRLAVGAVLILLGAAGYVGMVKVAYVLPQALTSIILALAGIVLLVTGATKKCGLYRLLGINTE